MHHQISYSAFQLRTSNTNPNQPRVDIAHIFPMSEPEDLAAYRETSEISEKTHDYGFLKRPCVDELFVHVGDVIEGYKDRWNLLEIGSPVYHGVRLDEATKKWRADYVELYSHSELLSFKVEPEPEPTPRTGAYPGPGKQSEDISPARAGQESSS
jgi:hypothetical protein